MLREIAALHGTNTGLLCRINGNQTFTSLGSAFLCHSRGYLLTCAHTFALTDTLGFIRSPTLEEFQPRQLNAAIPLTVNVAQYDAVNDVALLRLDIQGEGSLPAVEGMLMHNEANVPVGSSIAYIGYPYADLSLHTRHIASSTVSCKVLSSVGTRQFQLDAAVYEGCSGGPAIDVRTGRIFGVISSRFAPSGPQGGLRIMGDGRFLASDSNISYAISIAYGLAIMRAEGLDV